MKMTWEEMSARYCKTQEQTPEGLLEIIHKQISRWNPRGFFIAEAGLMDSSWWGSVVILPYGGPENTFKTVPTHPFSPRGLASDTSTVIGYMEVYDVPRKD